MRAERLALAAALLGLLAPMLAAQGGLGVQLPERSGEPPAGTRAPGQQQEGAPPVPQQAPVRGGARPRAGTGEAPATRAPASVPKQRTRAAAARPRQEAAAAAAARPADRGAGPCPAATERISAPGCPCTMHLDRERHLHERKHPGANGSTRGTDKGEAPPERGVCPAGYRCSPSAAAAILAGGWTHESAAGNRSSGMGLAASRLGAALAEQGICVPCQLGEYCPEGTQEETILSLSSCQLNPLSADPTSQFGAGSTTSQMGQVPATTGSCRGFKACPEGSYCPDAATAKPCEPGRWCPSGSTASEPCNITNMLTWNPFRAVRPPPVSMMEALVNAGSGLAGNMCPANATDPLASCPAGFFCPTPSQQLPCPKGFYCPPHFQYPLKCPALSGCLRTGLSAPEWSWQGLIMMLLLLGLLLGLLEYIRVAGRRRRMCSSMEDDVMQLIGAVGFQMISTQERYVLRRIKRRVSSGPEPGAPGKGDGASPDDGDEGGDTFLSGLPIARALTSRLRGLSFVGGAMRRHSNTAAMRRPAPGADGADADAGARGAAAAVEDTFDAEEKGELTHSVSVTKALTARLQLLSTAMAAQGRSMIQTAQRPKSRSSRAAGTGGGGDREPPGADGTSRQRPPLHPAAGSGPGGLPVSPHAQRGPAAAAPAAPLPLDAALQASPPRGGPLGEARELGGRTAGGGGAAGAAATAGTAAAGSPWLEPSGGQHTVVTIGGANNASATASAEASSPSGWWAAWRRRSQGAASTAAATGPAAERGASWSKEPSLLGPQHVVAPAAKIPAQGLPSSSASTTEELSGSGSELAEPLGDGGVQAYTINPRLTLVFRDVWVADRTMGGGLGCRLHRAAAALRGIGSAGSDGQTRMQLAVAADTRCDVAIQCTLAAAAADGVHFIVPGVSGFFKHSQLHAIMGPSGCGKTSLCKALGGRLPTNRVVGKVRALCSSAGDAPDAPPLELLVGPGHRAGECALIHMAGFVPQFDLLHESLTVMENLQFAARLRMPLMSAGRRRLHGGNVIMRSRTARSARSAEVHAVVEEVLALMALTKVAHQVVGSSAAHMVSGGQRKRAAIGVELVAKPSLLWLDEPTSGLDAAVAADVVSALKSSAERGMNVLAVMHQPRCSIFDMFDTLFLLSGAGHVVYAGPQHLALPYLGLLGFLSPPGENAADFLLDVVAGVVPRPGDPDFIPSQLATMWPRCGHLWVHRQIRLEAEGGVAPTASMAYRPAAANATVDWPWRPRDLEALLARFHLLVDVKRSAPAGSVTSAASHSGAATAVPALCSLDGSAAAAATATPCYSDGGAVVKTSVGYEGFLRFWEDAGLKEWLPKEQYDLFIEGLCEDFGMKPGGVISQAQFMSVLKAHLCAAAAEATGMPVAGGDTVVAGVPAAAGSPLAPPQPQLQPAAGAHGSAGGSGLGLGGPGAAHGGAVDEPQEQEALPVERTHTLAADSAFARFQAGPSSTDTDDDFLAEGCGPGEAADGPPTPLSPTAAAAAAAAAAACRAASRAAPCRSGPSMLGMRPAPGLLTCPTFRLRQQQMMRRQLEGEQPSDGGDRSGRGGGDDGSSAHGAGDSGHGAANGPPPGSSQPVAQFRKAAHAVMAARALGEQEAGGAGLQAQGGAQRARLGRLASGSVLPSLEETRTLRHLEEMVLQQEAMSTQQQEQPPKLPGADSEGGGALASPFSSPTVQARPVEGLAAGGSVALPAPAEPSQAVRPPPGSPGKHHPAPVPAGPSVGGPPALAPALGGSFAGSRRGRRSAAAAAISSRKLPPRLEQLRLIVMRSSRKWVSSRGALMTDLVLTALLGLALGVAQGRQNSPKSSMLWLLISLLAYGCMTLARSIHSFGSERHIFFQQESQAGITASAWVSGHQLFDVLGLLLHPLLFFMWLYVVTLTSIPASTYYATLVMVGWYTSGVGYLVSLAFPPRSALIAGLAAALVLGGVANGLAPALWTLKPSNPLMWLNQLSYTRWGLQVLFTWWLAPPRTPERAPEVAAFLSTLGFCGLEPSLLQALNADTSRGDATAVLNQLGGANTTGTGQAAASRDWWGMNAVQRADALAEATAEAHSSSAPGSESQATAAAAAALAQLWRYYNHPDDLTHECRSKGARALLVLLALGTGCRLLLLLLVKWKVARKAPE